MREKYKRFCDWCNKLDEKWEDLNIKRPIFGWISVYALVAILFWVIVRIYLPMFVDDTLIDLVNTFSSESWTSVEYAAMIGLVSPYFCFVISTVGMIDEHHCWLKRIRDKRQDSITE